MEEYRTINEMIERMSVREKARQLTQINAVYLKEESSAGITGKPEELGVSEQDIWDAGSVLNFMYGGEMSEIQETYLEKSEAKIPLIFMQDVVHGYRTIFPIPLAMGASFDTELAEECAKISALEARANGTQVTFAPMVDLVRDSRWGRVLETTGEDAWLNGEMGKAFIRGFHKGGLACCVKHFAAYGAAEAGKDYNTTDVSGHSLREFYLRAYHECLKEHPEMVMSSFNLLNGIPVNGHRELLVDLLRDEWNFDGVLVSDYNAIREMIYHGWLKNEKQCAETAANNEIDMEMMSGTYIQHLTELVEEGKVPEETIDRMLRRVLTLKRKVGLLENPYAGVDYDLAKRLELSEEHRELARKAARKSAVLLKNDGILPLKKEAQIALCGPFGEEQDILGAWSCFGKPEETVSVKEGLERLLQRKIPFARGCSAELLEENDSGISEAVERAKDAEVIITCIGEMSKDAGEGASRADLSIPQVQMELLRRLGELKIPMVAVVFGGRAQVLTEVEELTDAILYVWQPGTEGGNAIAELLYGLENPGGKLPISFPRTTGQCPIYYNHFRTGRPKGEDTIENSFYTSSYRDVINAPLYPFGYGLSYTIFEISEMKLSTTVLHRGETLTASILIENTGTRDGEEVIQMYLRDYTASVVRPVKELKAYQKIFMKAGEKRKVEFEITEETLKFYNAEGCFTAENGKFSLMIGNSSTNVLCEDFSLE